MIEAFGYVFFEDKEDFDSRVKFNDFRQTYVIENTCEFESYPLSFPAAYKRKACSSTPRYRAVDFVEAYVEFIEALFEQQHRAARAVFDRWDK